MIMWKEYKNNDDFNGNRYGAVNEGNALYSHFHLIYSSHMYTAHNTERRHLNAYV